MFDFTAARKNMVDGQIHPSGVVDPALLQAFENTPRELFVDDGLQKIACNDEEMAIGHGRMMLDPTTQARMIQALEVQQDDCVLEAGAGTGYASAILSSIVTTVVSVESDSDLLKKAQGIWDKLDCVNIFGHEGNLDQGYLKSAPYRLILVNGAVSEIPHELVDQLAPHGRLITIVKNKDDVLGKVTLVESLGDGQFSTYNLFSASAHYLPGFEPGQSFKF